MLESRCELGPQFAAWQQLSDQYASKLEDRFKGRKVDESELERLAEAMEAARQGYTDLGSL